MPGQEKKLLHSERPTSAPRLTTVGDRRCLGFYQIEECDFSSSCPFSTNPVIVLKEGWVHGCGLERGSGEREANDGDFYSSGLLSA